jgi:hypothetical protein
MLNCYRATELISAAQDRPLTMQERISLFLHLRICTGCKNFNNHMKILRISAKKFTKTEK